MAKALYLILLHNSLALIRVTEDSNPTEVETKSSNLLKMDIELDLKQSF